MIKISVIVPIYKVERYIANAVESILKQTYTDFEVLLIDDGSPDKSIEICQQFRDPRIRIIHQKNRGLAGARNTGIRLAQGQYLAFLDGDDVWLPEKLEKHIEHLERSNTVGVSFSRSAFIDENSLLLGTFLMPQLSAIKTSDLLCSNPVGNGSAAVIRREVFEQIRFEENVNGTLEEFYFDECFRQSEDIECWLRIAISTSWKIEGIPDVLTLYRVNSVSLSTNLLQQFESWKQVLEKTRSYAPKLIAQWENVSKAHQLQYLSRHAVRLREGTLAVKLIHQSIKTHWHILLEEPRRMFLTLLAAYLLYLLPRFIFYKIDSLAAKIIGSTQKSYIIQDISKLPV